MGLFGRKSANRSPAELGGGVWRHDHDRFGRAVDRFYAVVTGIDADLGKPDGTCAPREALAALTLQLNDAADRVHRICADAERRAPTDGMTLPGDQPALLDVQRDVSRAATAVAQAAQGAFLVRVALRDGEKADDGPAARAVEQAESHIGAAENALRSVGRPPPPAPPG